MSRERACEWRTPSLYEGVQKYYSILLSAISSSGLYLYDNTYKVNQELIGVDINTVEQLSINFLMFTDNAVIFPKLWKHCENKDKIALNNLKQYCDKRSLSVNTCIENMTENGEFSIEMKAGHLITKSKNSFIQLGLQKHFQGRH